MVKSFSVEQSDLTAVYKSWNEKVSLGLMLLLFSTSRQNFSLVCKPALLKQSSLPFTMILKFKEFLELHCISGRNNGFFFIWNLN